MKPRKPVQAISIAGELFKPGDNRAVDTHKITPTQRKWDGRLVHIRDLRNGKSQVVYPSKS